MIKLFVTFLSCFIVFVNCFSQQNTITFAGKVNQNKKLVTTHYNKFVKQPLIDPFDNISENILQIGAYISHGNSFTSPSVLDEGIGFGLKLGLNLLETESPFSIYAGLGFDYLIFGGKDSKKSNNVDIEINSNAYGWYPYIDLELGPSWPVTIFGTAYWGGRFFKTRQNINYIDSKNQPQTDTKNLEGDVTQIFGIGGGLKIKIVSALKLELRYQRNYGNILNIVDPNSIQFDSSGNLKSYQNKSTDTDLDMLFVGFLFCL